MKRKKGGKAVQPMPVEDFYLVGRRPSLVSSESHRGRMFSFFFGIATIERRRSSSFRPALILPHDLRLFFRALRVDARFKTPVVSRHEFPFRERELFAPSPWSRVLKGTVSELLSFQRPSSPSHESVEKIYGRVEERTCAPLNRPGNRMCDLKINTRRIKSAGGSNPRTRRHSWVNTPPPEIFAPLARSPHSPSNYCTRSLPPSLSLFSFISLSSSLSLA